MLQKGSDQTLAALGIAWLTAVHGEPVPEAVPHALRAIFQGLRLGDTRLLQHRAQTCSNALPEGWKRHPFAQRVYAAALVQESAAKGDF